MTIDRDHAPDRDGLTDTGRAEVEALARRHGVGVDAVVVLLRALERGGGSQAQFSHPDLGGMGQWSRGGMIMVGDMFNNGLKARVDRLCLDTAALVATPGITRSEDRVTRGGTWWPADCGRPSATGAQNDMRYACFPDTRRLAIGHGDTVELYDTGEHRVQGVSQQQGDAHDIRFTSQLGPITLHDLRRIDARGTDARPVKMESPARPSASVAPEPSDRSPESRPTESRPDVLDTLERLHALHRKGILDEAEFAAKKKELLARV